MTSPLLGPLLVLAAQTPSPSPTPTEHTIYTVTPGIGGFIAFFALALAGWLLFRSLVKHMRRVDHETLRREQAAAAAEPGEGGPSGEPTPSGPDVAPGQDAPSGEDAAPGSGPGPVR
ncbi:hypothetical protein [uncultured Georgenia sp.]|uniref:hypothetical protein n=1 Tax=uncultured Georgenia sp. TaxID=378209 RepID=UPI00262700B2|nr:hypothetical protein [uncultured Georgenia sp.]HLV04265.1 hypothetical protein [Actinomycetaceae bacterium]